MYEEDKEEFLEDDFQDALDIFKAKWEKKGIVITNVKYEVKEVKGVN